MATKNSKKNSNAKGANTTHEKTPRENSNASEDFKISGNWRAQSGVLQEKFAQLTDADVKFEEGEEEDLLERIGTRLNKKREEIINIIKKGV